MSDKSKLKKGQTVEIIIPFSYQIGETGAYTNKVLETMQDCKNELIAEVESGDLNGNIYLEER